MFAKRAKAPERKRTTLRVEPAPALAHPATEFMLDHQLGRYTAGSCLGSGPPNDPGKMNPSLLPMLWAEQCAATSTARGPDQRPMRLRMAEASAAKRQRSNLLITEQVDMVAHSAPRPPRPR